MCMEICSLILFGKKKHRLVRRCVSRRDGDNLVLTDQLKAYDYMFRFEKSFNGFETVGNALLFWIYAVNPVPWNWRLAAFSVSTGRGSWSCKNRTLKLYFLTYNLRLLYSRICFPALSGCQISHTLKILPLYFTEMWLPVKR